MVTQVTNASTNVDGIFISASGTITTDLVNAWSSFAAVGIIEPHLVADVPDVSPPVTVPSDAGDLVRSYY